MGVPSYLIPGVLPRVALPEISTMTLPLGLAAAMVTKSREQCVPLTGPTPASLREPPPSLLPSSGLSSAAVSQITINSVHTKQQLSISSQPCRSEVRLSVPGSSARGLARLNVKVPRASDPMTLISQTNKHTGSKC